MCIYLYLYLYIYHLHNIPSHISTSHISTFPNKNSALRSLETVNKSVKAKLKKRLGLPPARNIGSKETKAAMKRLDRRMLLGSWC